ncbi:MAG: DUF1269 domain-containing protein [Microthrixaceae bacterium]
MSAVKAAGAVIDLGIHDDTVARMREALPEGKVGVLVLATVTDPQAVLEEFHRFAGEAELVTADLPPTRWPGAGLLWWTPTPVAADRPYSVQGATGT